MHIDSAASPTLIQSLQRGMRLVEAVSENGPLTARVLSERTGIALPTAYHLLRTLVHEGYLHRSVEGRYSLGEQMTSVTQLERRARTLRLIRDEMSELAAAARVTVSIGELKGDAIVVTELIGHPATPRFECWPGMEIPGHATAIGKNILGRMSSQQRFDYLQKHPLQPITSHTVTTGWRLELDLVTSTVTHCDQQCFYGITCTATALDNNSRLMALGAAYSSTRSSRGRDQIDDQVVSAATRLVNAVSLVSPQDAGITEGEGPDASLAVGLNIDEPTH